MRAEVKKAIVTMVVIGVLYASATHLIIFYSTAKKHPVSSPAEIWKHGHLVAPITLYINGSQEPPPALRDIRLNSTDTYILVIYVDVYLKTGEIVAKEYILFRIEDGELRYIAKRLENF